MEENCPPWRGDSQALGVQLGIVHGRTSVRAGTILRSTPWRPAGPLDQQLDAAGPAGKAGLPLAGWEAKASHVPALTPRPRRRRQGSPKATSEASPPLTVPTDVGSDAPATVQIPRSYKRGYSQASPPRCWGYPHSSRKDLNIVMLIYPIEGIKAWQMSR